MPQPTGTRHRRSTPYQAYRTSDGYVTVGAANDRLWLRLIGALERPEWETDPRFATLPDRMEHIDELEREKQRWDDPAYVKAQARARFGYLMPGEQGFEVIGEDGRLLEAIVAGDAERARRRRAEGRSFDADEL